MVTLRYLVASALTLCFVEGAPRQATRGPSPVLARSQPFGNTSSHAPSTAAGGGTCGGCTIEVRDASLAWWYGATFWYQLGVFDLAAGQDVISGSQYTYIANTDKFDVTEEVRYNAYTKSPLNSFWGTEWVDDPYTVTPGASVTQVVTRSRVLPIQSTIVTAVDSADLLSYKITPGPATAPILQATVTVSIATSTTPFAQFTAYEIERKVPFTQSNGNVGCATSTSTITLAQPVIFQPTWESDNGPEGQNRVTYRLPSAVVSNLPDVATCVAGNYNAAVTVLVVVDASYFASTDPPEVGLVQTTATGFATYTPPIKQDDLLPIFSTTLEESATSSASMQPVPTYQLAAASERSVTKISTGYVVVVQQTSTLADAKVEVRTRTRNFGAVISEIVAHSSKLQPGSNFAAPSTVQLPHPPPPILTIGTQTITGNAATQYNFGSGQTLIPNGVVTVGQTTISLAQSVDYIVVNGQTQPLSSATVMPGQEPATLTIDGQTLTPGGFITASGAIISLDNSGSTIVVNGNTMVLADVAATTTPPVLTIRGSLYTALPGRGITYLIGGQPLTPGGAITVAGLTISLAPSASALIVDSKTTPLIIPTPTAAAAAAAAALTGAPKSAISPLGASQTAHFSDGHIAPTGTAPKPAKAAGAHISIPISNFAGTYWTYLLGCFVFPTVLGLAI